ncbi:hypothetical protein AOX59_13485 [Lentibacillus amyloliquefaciens]|uniref:Uncharacterized protein n=1 Tax=Lentibacillus amyloliquefaciens TaxID=1472767 RepID=A0A0U4F9J7_9BACI|nr:hypothetical protein AOX59_13485 [Lentibacillus amyloliquefaciens]
MNILLYLIGPLIAVFVVSTVMSVIYKNEEKKDKGFVLNYHKLTYRRRLIRAVWGVPIVSLIYLALYWFSDLTSNEYKIIGIIFLFLVLLDIVHNYEKWKRNEKK